MAVRCCPFRLSFDFNRIHYLVASPARCATGLVLYLLFLRRPSLCGIRKPSSARPVYPSFALRFDMLRRILLVLSTISVILSVESRPAPATAEPEHHHLEPRAGVPFTPGSPIIVPVGDPAMLLGRHYQVVKRDPSPLQLPPALAAQLNRPKGEAPASASPTATSAPAKRAVAPFPLHLARRDRHDANLVSNVGPPPPSYPRYVQYGTPPPSTTTTTTAARPAKSTLAGSSTPDDKKDGHGGAKKKAGAKNAAREAETELEKKEAEVAKHMRLSG